MNSRLTSLIRKEFIQIIRDPRTLVIAILIPVMQLFLLGYAATNDVRNIPLAVFDQDRGQAARALLDAYRASDYFLLSFDVNSETEIHHLIDSGKAGAGLIALGQVISGSSKFAPDPDMISWLEFIGYMITGIGGAFTVWGIGHKLEKNQVSVVANVLSKASSTLQPPGQADLKQ